MGLLDFGANIVMRLKADTSDAKAKLRELTAEEKKAADAAVKLTEANNKAIERKAKNWQLAAQAVGAVTAAYAVGKSGLEAYAKTSEHAAASVNRIKDASSKAFDSLMASVGKAVVGLEPLISGISTLVQKLSDVGVAGPAAIGALALAVTGNPVIAGIVGGGAWALSGDFGSGDLIGPDGSISIARGMINTRRKKIAKMTGNWGSQYGVDDLSGDISGAAEKLGNLFVAGLNRVGVSPWSRFEVKTGSREDNRLDPDNLRTYGSRYRIGAGPGSTGVGAYDLGFEDRGINTLMAQQRAAFDAGSRGLMSPYAAQGSGIAGAQESQLSRMFGPLSDFNAYQAAFESLSGAIGSALGAWIDGSVSAGKAFKAFISEAVKGLAVQMTIEALKHGAYAIGSAAMGNFAGAAMHGKAAAGFAAGAIAASIAAKGLHSGGGSGPVSSGSYGGAPSTIGGGSGSSGPATNVTIVYGDSFARDNPHERQLEATKLVNMGMDTARKAVKAR